MKDQLMEAIDIFGEQVPNAVTSPTARHLLGISQNAVQLDKHRSEVFQYVTVKILYATKRAQPDIYPTVVFLCARVSKSDKDDWKNYINFSDL